MNLANGPRSIVDLWRLWLIHNHSAIYHDVLPYGATPIAFITTFTGLVFGLLGVQKMSIFWFGLSDCAIAVTALVLAGRAAIPPAIPIVIRILLLCCEIRSWFKSSKEGTEHVDTIRVQNPRA